MLLFNFGPSLQVLLVKQQQDFSTYLYVPTAQVSGEILAGLRAVPAAVSPARIPQDPTMLQLAATNSRARSGVFRCEQNNSSTLRQIQMLFSCKWC